MAIVETLRALGRWDVSLRRTIPDDMWKKIEYFGHICIHVGRNPGPLDDSLLKSARYVGPVRSIAENSGADRSIGGLGMASWLGDPDGKGDIIKDPLIVNDQFHIVIAQLLPASGSVTAGSIFNIGQTFSSTFQFQTPRAAIDYVCQTVPPDAGWRVNGDGTLDAGLESQLFKTNPECILVNKKIARNVAAFEDMVLKGLAGTAETGRDVEDYSTDVLLLAQGINGQFVQAEANTPIGNIPFFDIHGNKVKLERIVQESETDATNAPARAQLQLNRFSGSRDALTLSTSNYDIKGTAQVGDYIWVYDPGMGLIDTNNEVPWRAQRINPFKLRLTEMSWPITDNMSVFYRSGSGVWIDLTKYVIPETGETSLVVGGYNRSLTEGGSSPFPVSPPPDTSVPDVVTWVTPFRLSTYQSDVSGEARGEVILTWNQPNNTDTTTIVDGDHYEIRYRRDTTPIYPTTWGQLEALGLTWGAWEATGATWDEPVQYPETEWQTAFAPFDMQSYRLQELVPAMAYEAQIRAVDTATPPNVGAWSAVTEWQTSSDDIAPSTPAALIVAANPMAVQVTHNLGISSGGTFNLERDLHHLEIHGGNSAFFFPDENTLLGKVIANWGMMQAQVPVVESFQISSIHPVYYKAVAVDLSGNKSTPSPGAVQTAELIDDQYISNLTVSKVTAGVIKADWFVGADISGAAIHVDGPGGIDVTGGGSIEVKGGGNVEVTDGAFIVYNAAGHKILEAGECEDGRHGLQVYKDDGTRVARVGELVSGSEGIEVIDDIGRLVRIDTLAFGIEAATVATAQTTASGAYTDLATIGPLTNVDVGNSVRMIVIVSASVNPTGVSGGTGWVSFDIAGPGGYVSFASDQRGVGISANNTVILTSQSKAFLVSGLPQAGNYTAALKYKSSGTTSFFDRHIIMIPF